MICYLDRAFCTHSSCLMGKCVNLECYRNYTPNDQLRNDTQFGLPVSITDFKGDDCGYTEGEINGS